MEVAASYGEPKETPIVIKVIFYAIEILIVVFLLVTAIRYMLHCVTEFSRDVCEEDDKVEMIVKTDVEEQIAKRNFAFRRSNENLIRREYRKFIKKHRKDRPAPFETPREMEQAAGVFDTIEGKELHDKYERVRYYR